MVHPLPEELAPAALPELGAFRISFAMCINRMCPNFGAQYGTEEGSWCLDPRFEEVGRAAGETALDDGHCVEFGPPYQDRYGHRNQLLGTFRELRNVCAYGVELVMCYVPPNDQFTRSALCGEVGRYYPIGFDRHLQGGGSAGSGSRVHADPVEWAACRHGFDPDGFDGSGGFRCLGDGRGSNAPQSGGGRSGPGDSAAGAADAPREPAASSGGVLTSDD